MKTPSSLRRRACWAAAGALALGASCMPPIRRMTAFSTRFADNNRANIQAVYAGLPAPHAAERASNALGVPVMAAVLQDANHSVALFDLAANRQVWASPVHSTSAPEILGDIVVVAEGGRVVALDLRTGARRWAVETRGLPFIGAARQGQAVVIVLSLGAQGAGARVGRVLAVDANSGGTHWSHEVVGILGRPATDGGFAFIPWDRQSIAVLDLGSGVERARVRATDDVLSWVAASPQGVFYGSRGAYRWTPRSASGSREGSAYLANPLENVPGNPPLFRDAFAQTTGTRTARDKIRFAFLPLAAEHDGLAVAHGAIYLAYYRFLIAVDAHTGEVRWARAFGPDEAPATPAAAGAAGEQVTAAEAARRAQASFSAYDIESVSVTPGAIVAIGGDGRVYSLDPGTGAIVGTTELHAAIGAITTDLAGYHPPTAGTAPAPEGSVREQLIALIRDPDNRLVPIREYLVHMLARRPEEEATRDLLELYRQRSIPSTLRQSIAASLRERHNGAQFLVAALDGEQGHYNFLENRQAPPLDVIAPTLAQMGARQAVPVLMQHMLDHETPVASLPAVINAIAQLGDASVIPQLRAFTQRYKSDSAFAEDRIAPLATAAAAIFRLGDAESRQWLTSLSRDASAHAPLRQSITQLFEDERRGGEGRSQDQQLAAAREALQGRVNALRAAVSAYPSMLTTEAFEGEWTGHLDELRECAVSVIARRPNLNEIRITVTLRSEPAAELFRTSPPTPRLGARPTFQQQLDALQQQGRWVDEHIAQVEAHRSTVRTAAYSPQDPEMQRCMDAVLRPVRFPGFGRGIATRTFQQQISTVRAQAQGNGVPGFGMTAGSAVLVPWFLVSSPSYNAATNELVVAPPASGPVPYPTPSSTPTATGDAGVAATPQGDGGASTTPAATARPWWEEQ